MIQRLIAICVFLTISACAAAPPPKAPALDAKKTPVQKKRSAPKHKADISPEQVQRQDRKRAFDAFADTPIKILPDEILIVGRIKLSPPLHPEELEALTGDMETRRDKAVMVRSIVVEPLPAEKALSTADTFDAPLDKDFLLTLQHQPVALLGGYIYISGERGLVSAVKLPGSWQLGIREQDRAIYIGTIHYVRNEYDTILDYIIEDDYPQAYETYQHRLEEGIILRKELVRWKKGDWTGP